MAIQLIMVLIAVWTLYVTRRVSPTASSKKKARKASITCVRRILKKKAAMLSMLNPESILFSEKKVSIDTLRIAFSKKALSVKNCGQKKAANIGMPIKNSGAASGIPLKKILQNPFLGLSKKSVSQTVFGWGDKKRLGLGVYA